jgi:hypothetical protein
MAVNILLFKTAVERHVKPFPRKTDDQSVTPPRRPAQQIDEHSVAAESVEPLHDDFEYDISGCP